MNLARLLPAAAALAVLLASCSDDPLGPSGPYSPPEYHATLQSLDTPFSGVTGTGKGDIYALGGILLRYDGSTWKPMPGPRELDSWQNFLVGFDDGGLAASDGRDVSLFHDGSWTPIERVPDYSNAFWGRASDDLYAINWNGLYHYDGTSWSLLPLSANGELRAIAGDETGHPIMAGTRGRIDRFNGVDWTSTNLDTTGWFGSIAVTSSGRTFVSDGARIFEVAAGDSLALILSDQIYDPRLCTDGEVLYAAGRSPYEWGTYRVAEYRDNTWRAVDQGQGYMRSFWAGHGELAGVGENNFIWHGTASGGDQVELPPVRRGLADAVTIGDAIYAVGEGAYRYQDGEWTDLDKEYITRNPARGIGGRRSDDIYAVGSEMILHYDGRSWQWVNSGLGEELRSVWVGPEGHVVAVGWGPVIVEYDGTTWTKKEIPLSGDLNDVTGVGNTVFAVGGGLAGVRKNNHWYFSRPSGWALNAVWAYAEDRAYAVGNEDNTLWTYDGSRWTPSPIEGPAMPSMSGIWGTSPSNLFILDYYGTLVHFDGSGWREEERIFGAGMRAITGTPHEVLTLGDTGSILYRK
ncbi:MAG TPA: hypothetical protein VF247_01510 [Candidatus Krumholzibacteria bacterium]